MILTIAYVITSGVVAGSLEDFKLGDRIVVVAESVDVMSGSDVVATLPRGYAATVRDVKNDSLGIVVSRIGYIARQDVLPINQSVAYFTELIRADSQDATLFHGRALCHQELGEFEEAILDFGQAIRLDRQNAAAYGNRGRVWMLLKEYHLAIADFTESIRYKDLQGAANSSRAIAFNNRGNAWRKRGDYGKAIADFAESIRLDPEYEGAYAGEAWVRATCPDDRFRDGKKAIESATRGCALTEWKEPSNVQILAAAYAESGDFANALKWQTTALDLASAGEKSEYEFCLELFRNKQPYRERIEE